jgi:hypothetical protein
VFKKKANRAANPREPIPLGEVITIVATSVALILSLVNFYKEFLYSHEELVISTPSATLSTSGQVPSAAATADVSVFNVGNVTGLASKIIMLGARIQTMDSEGNEFDVMYPIGQFHVGR